MDHKPQVVGPRLLVAVGIEAKNLFGALDPFSGHRHGAIGLRVKSKLSINTLLQNFLRRGKAE